MQEGAVMATMDHINVVRLYSVCMGKQMMLITEFVRLGSLLSYLTKNQATLDADTMLNFSKQIADVSVLTSDGFDGASRRTMYMCTVHLYGTCTPLPLLPLHPWSPGYGISGGEKDGP